MTRFPSRAPRVRPRPPLFRALGRADVPARIIIGEQSYALVQVFKHDSWAATALYSGHARKVVCKFNRQEPIGFVPMRWLGRLLANREADFLRRLACISNVPRWSGDVRTGKERIPYAVAHDYIAGHALAAHENVSPAFVAKLQQVLAEIHRQSVAYVDLHKRENILVGDDGQPYFVDFQIGFALGLRWPANSLPMRLLLRMFQRSDEYHLAKHARHLLSSSSNVDDARWRQFERPWWIRAHRMVAQPFRSFRRWLLVQLGIRNRSGRASSEFFPEVGVR